MNRSRGLMATLYTEGLCPLVLGPWEVAVAVRDEVAVGVVFRPSVPCRDVFATDEHTRLAAGEGETSVVTWAAPLSDGRFDKVEGSAGGSGDGSVTSIGSGSSSAGFEAMSDAASVVPG